MRVLYSASLLLLVVASGVPSAAQPTCVIRFQVVRWYDHGKPIIGLAGDEQAWYEKALRKKYPSVCYESDSSSRTINALLAISVDHDRRSGSETVTETESVPFTASENIEINSPSGQQVASGQGTINGNAEVTTSHSASYEWENTRCLLEVRVWDPSGKWVTMSHFVRGRGVYHGENGYESLGNAVGLAFNRHPELSILKDGVKFLSSSKR